MCLYHLIFYWSEKDQTLSFTLFTGNEGLGEHGNEENAMASDSKL